MTAGGSK